MDFWSHLTSESLYAITKDDSEANWISWNSFGGRVLGLVGAVSYAAFE
jgi:hypothetical protein